MKHLPTPTIMSAMLAIIALSIAVTGCGGSDSKNAKRSDSAAKAVGPPVGDGVDGVTELKLHLATDKENVVTARWKPVKGATYYRVVALGKDKTPVWSWEGPETTVELGAGTPVDDTIPGSPRTVSVTAWNKSGALAGSRKMVVGG